MIMALLFLTVGSLIVVSLANLTGTNLLNTSGLQAQRNFEYAADAATDGAVQSVRYHGTCESFEPTETMDNYHVLVSCAGLPISVGTTGGSTTLTAPTGTFVAEDVGQQIAYTCASSCPGGVTTLGFTTIKTVNSSSVITTARAAPANATGATIGNPNQRVDLVTACVSTTSFSGGATCSAASAVIRSVVQYVDVDQSARYAVGYSLDTLDWVVNTANG